MIDFVTVFLEGVALTTGITVAILVSIDVVAVVVKGILK